LFLLCPLFIHTPAYAAVVINEIVPKTEPAANEWVELYNTDSSSVSLNQWRLQNTTGTVQTYILNASAIIASHGFLTLNGSQTNMSFSIGGDTVRIFDEKNNEVDSQSYPGILGYNTAMGRSIDGSGIWTLCTTATYNMPNDCPQPSPTPTPTVTPTPMLPQTPTTIITPATIPSPTVGVTPTINPTNTRLTFGSLLPSPTGTDVLGAATRTSPTPTPTPDTTHLTIKIDKILAFQIVFVLISWGILAGIAYVQQHRKKRATS
jgi:hypothetical protein